MIKIKSQTKHLVLLLLASLFLFSGSHTQFFSADDWFHLRISQVSSPVEFLNFFKFSETSQQASFYRPLPTQFFFFLFSTLFNLNSTPYYFFVFLGHLLLVILVYGLFSQLFKKRQALIASILFTFSHTHFTRIYFLSAFQETVMAIFVVMFIRFFLAENARKYWFGLGFFILALMSKETAIIAPFLLVLTLIAQDKKSSSLKELAQTLMVKLNERKGVLFIIAIISIIYLILRFGVFGFAHTKTDYHWSWQPKQVVSTARWYLMWGMGLPETIVNYMPSMFSISNKFFADFSTKAYLTVSLIFLSVAIYLASFFNLLKTKILTKESNMQLYKYSLLGVLWFFATLGPLLLLPTHLFALEMTLPIIGFAIAVSVLVVSQSKIVQLAFIAIFISLNLISVLIAKKSHYSLVRSQISRNVHQALFKEESKDSPQVIIFINDTKRVTEAWGSSRQIQQALMDDEYFKFIFKEDVPMVIYQDALPDNHDLDLVIQQLESDQADIKKFFTSNFVNF